MAEKRRPSALEQALEKRERRFFEFDVTDVFGLDGEARHRIAIRAPNRDEEDRAVDGAHEYAAKKSEGARTDPDIMTEAKALGVIRRCVFEAGEMKDADRTQVFGSVDWCRKNMTSDEIAVIFNMVEEVRRKVSALRTGIELDMVDRLARTCWAARDTDIPEALLADCDREFLSQAFVLLACQCAEASGWGEEAETDETSEDDTDADAD